MLLKSVYVGVREFRKLKTNGPGSTVNLVLNVYCSFGVKMSDHVTKGHNTRFIFEFVHFK